MHHTEKKFCSQESNEVKDKPKGIYGVLAQFETPTALYHACEKIRDHGFKKWDAYTPFAVHGLDKAMALPQSKLPWLVGGVSGVCGLAGYLTWCWMNASDYKFVIAGKPFYSWPAYLLPGFECAMITGAVMSLVGMLILNRLPQHYCDLFRSERFRAATNDKFFIAIEAKDKNFQEQKVKELFTVCGASYIETVLEY